MFFNLSCLLLKIYQYRLRCSSSIKAEEEEDDDDDADNEADTSNAEVTGSCSRCLFLFLNCSITGI